MNSTKGRWIIQFKIFSRLRVNYPILSRQTLGLELLSLLHSMFFYPETLISRHGNQDSDDGAGEFQMEISEQQNDSQDNPTSQSEVPPSKMWACFYVISASVMASLGGVLFGYDMGN